MSILLISPSIRYSASNNYPDGIPRSISRNFGVYPWLGLCYIASFLKKWNFESEIIDIDAECLSIKKVIKKICRLNPSIIGISTISFTFLYALKLAREIKRHFDVPIVFGGPHVSIYPKEVVMNDCIDIGVIGEGEETFLEIATIFRDGNQNYIYEKLKKIKGIAYKFNGEIIITEKRNFIENIDLLPTPAIEKLKICRYYGCNHVKPYITMVTARGCLFNCSFCSKQPWGDNFRFHSAERVADEIEYYVRGFGIRAIDFYDDTFTVPRSRTLEIMDLIRKRNIKFDFGMMTRVDCVDRELICNLKNAGCKVIAYGVEFGDTDIQKKADKKFSAEIIKNAFRLANEAGIRTVGFFMIGYPEETEKEIYSTINLMKELNADYAKTNILIPYPGSKLYNQLVSSGRLKVDFWAELTKGNISPITSLIKSKISIPRLIRFRNYMNRLPYIRRRSNVFKFQKVKSFQDIKRTLGILIGSYLDRKV